MDKAPDAFRTISEVADELDIPQHVLRFWETRFAQIKPVHRGQASGLGAIGLRAVLGDEIERAQCALGGLVGAQVRLGIGGLFGELGYRGAVYQQQPIDSPVWNTFFLLLGYRVSTN